MEVDNSMEFRPKPSNHFTHSTQHWMMRAYITCFNMMQSDARIFFCYTFPCTSGCFGYRAKYQHFIDGQMFSFSQHLKLAGAKLSMFYSHRFFFRMDFSEWIKTTLKSMLH